VYEVLHLPIDGGVHLGITSHAHVQLELEQGAGLQHLLVFKGSKKKNRSKKIKEKKYGTYVSTCRDAHN
jgi:hypothetical protein